MTGEHQDSRPAPPQPLRRPAASLPHLTDGQAGWFIAGKLREVLGQRPRIASEEQARRADLSARVMSGELDDVNLYVRKTSRDGLSPAQGPKTHRVGPNAVSQPPGTALILEA
jgi:hypothetical protein